MGIERRLSAPCLCLHSWTTFRLYYCTCCAAPSSNRPVAIAAPREAHKTGVFGVRFALTTSRWLKHAVAENVDRICLKTGDNCIDSVYGPTCQGLPNGDYQSCWGCRGYSSCVNGAMHEWRLCPGGMIWNDDEKHCAVPPSPTCTECTVELPSKH